MKNYLKYFIIISFLHIINVYGQANNLLHNSSFEDGATQPIGWATNTGYGATFLWDNQLARTGNYSLSTFNLSLPWSAMSWEPQSNIAVEPSVKYDLSVWVFFNVQPSSGESAEIGMTEYDENGNFVSGGGVVANPVPGNWTFCTYSFTTKPNTKSIKISLSHIFRNNDDLAKVNFDDVSLVKYIPPLQVNLILPKINSTKLSTTPNFSWSTFEGATTYSLQISASSDFTNLFQEYSTNSTNFTIPVALNNNTVYWWRVKADNSTWSVSRSFTVGTSLSIIIQDKNLSTGLVIVNGVDMSPILTNSPFTFDWGDGSITKGWFVQEHIYSDVTKNYLLQVTANYLDGTTDTKTTIVYFTPKTSTLNVNLQSIDKTTGLVIVNGADMSPFLVNPPFTFDWGDGTQTKGWFVQEHTYTNLSKNYTITVTSTYLDGTIDSKLIAVNFAITNPLILISPLMNQNQVDINATFSWQPVPEAKNYTLQISYTPNFDHPAFSYETIAETFTVPQSLNENVICWWRVKADNSKWSTVWNFISGFNTVPRLIEPKNGFTEVPALNAFLTCNWVQFATSFRLLVAEDASFANVVISKEQNNPNFNGLNFTQGRSYYWKIQALVNNKWSNWSEVRNFTVNTIKISIPSYKFFSIDYSIPGNSTLNFRGSLAGDVRGDGIQRIVIGGGKSGKLFVYRIVNNNLQLENEIQIVSNPLNSTNVIPKAIGDIDGDNINEIIVLSSGLSEQPEPNLLQVLKWNNTEYVEVLRYKNFDFNIYDQSTIMITNIDKAGLNEIIMPVNGRLGIYSYSEGNFRKIAELNRNVEQKFGVGNCDFDLNTEIVISEISQPEGNPVNLLILELNGSNLIIEKSISNFAYPVAGVAIQDLNKDGISEIFCATGQYTCYEYYTTILHYNGTDYVADQNFRFEPYGVTKAKVGDIDGDGSNEIVMFRNSGGSYVIDFESGNYVFGYVNHAGIVDDGDLCDLDFDGSAEILAGTYGVTQIVSIANQPPSVELIAPSPGTQSVSLNPALSWKAVQGASIYFIQISTNPDMLYPQRFTTKNSTYIIPVTLNENSDYYWRVRADNTTFSPIWKFTTLTLSKPIQVTYKCDMQYEIASGRFNPQSDFVELRGTEFGWTSGIRMVQNPNQPNLYSVTVTQKVKAQSEKMPDYKFWYTSNIFGEFWENDPNRAHIITQEEFDSRTVSIQRVFDDLTPEIMTNRDVSILIQINLNGGKDVNGNPLNAQINSVHLTGSTVPLSWQGWNKQNSQYMTLMFDDGTHGDLKAKDGIYSNLITFPILTKYRVEMAYVINYDMTNPQNVVYENVTHDNHVFMLEKDMVRAKLINTFGFMSNFGELITPLYDKEYIAIVEKTLATSCFNNLINSTSGKLQKDLLKSYDSFKQSLDPKLWQDESHLSTQGQLMFELSKNSVSDLMKLSKESIYTTSILPLILHIYNSDKYIVELLYSESILKFAEKGCTNSSTTGDCAKWKKDLDDAFNIMKSASNDFSIGNYDKAILTFKLAWMNLKKVQSAGLAKKNGEYIVEEEIPVEFNLFQNYPNPFNPTTKIKFGLPENSYTKLIVYDLLGREIKTLINSEMSAGYHEVVFNASELPSGIYFYKIQASSFSESKKMLLIK